MVQSRGGQSAPREDENAPTRHKNTALAPSADQPAARSSLSLRFRPSPRFPVSPIPRFLLPPPLWLPATGHWLLLLQIEPIAASAQQLSSTHCRPSTVPKQNEATCNPLPSVFIRVDLWLLIPEFIPNKLISPSYIPSERPITAPASVQRQARSLASEYGSMALAFSFRAPR